MIWVISNETYKAKIIPICNGTPCAMCLDDKKGFPFLCMCLLLLWIYQQTHLLHPHVSMKSKNHEKIDYHSNFECERKKQSETEIKKKLMNNSYFV